MRTLASLAMLVLIAPATALAPSTPDAETMLRATPAARWLDLAGELSLDATAPAEPVDLAHAMARLYAVADVPPAAIDASGLDAAQQGALGALVAAIADAWGATDIDAALGLLEALRAYRASGPIAPFADPLGLVVVGTAGPDHHASDAVLLVDPAGDDVYTNSAGGACVRDASTPPPCNGLAVSLVLDLAGDDVYDSTGRAVQGAGFLGIGILADLTGDDRYHASIPRDSFAQGAGAVGVGILLDAAGNDERRVSLAQSEGFYHYAQGAGILGGVGIAADQGGSDLWRVEGEAGIWHAFLAQGAADVGGVGILHASGGGATRYEVVAGEAEAWVHGASFGSSVGIVFDDAGDDVREMRFANGQWYGINAFGTADSLGTAVALDLAGDDVWDIEAAAGAIHAEGQTLWYNVHAIFVDAEGDDVHRFVAPGVLVQASPTIVSGTALFLDGEGQDTYEGGRLYDAFFGPEWAVTVGWV